MNAEYAIELLLTNPTERNYCFAMGYKAALDESDILSDELRASFKAAFEFYRGMDK